MTEKNINVLYLGISGFPERIMAANQKTKMICQALVESSVNVLVINKRGIFDKKEKRLVKASYKGIRYVYASGTPYRSNSFVGRRFGQIKSLIGEFLIIYRQHKQSGIHAAILYERFFINILRYKLYSIIFRFPLILNYVEYMSSLPESGNIFKRINAYCFDNLSCRIIRGAFPTSSFLEQNIQKKIPSLKYLKIPALSDFHLHTTNKGSAGSDKVFIFCGYLIYFEIILFIIQAFSRLDDLNASLHLVVNGDKGKYKNLEEIIRLNPKSDRIKIFSNLSTEELYAKYCQAVGLLIPLRPTTQDEARFPFKIAEYVSSATPIITTRYGVIKEYFDDDTALIANEYDIEQYAEKMNFVLQYPEQAKVIGKNAYVMGQREFHYKNFSNKLKEFIQKI